MLVTFLLVTAPEILPKNLVGILSMAMVELHKFRPSMDKKLLHSLITKIHLLDKELKFLTKNNNMLRFYNNK